MVIRFTTFPSGCLCKCFVFFLSLSFELEHSNIRKRNGKEQDDSGSDVVLFMGSVHISMLLRWRATNIVSDVVQNDGHEALFLTYIVQYSTFRVKT